jgi:predicted PurR-regulated permease PerM
MSGEKKPDILLGDRQRQFIAFVLCFAGVLLLGCLIAAVIYILNQAFSLFAGVIWSLALSGMLAILFRPLVSLLEEKIGLSRMFSILILYGLVVFTAGGATWFLGAKVLQQSQGFIGAASEWPDRLEEKGKKHLPPDTWDAVAGQFQAFKDYWQDMLGKDASVGKLVLQPAEKEIYNSLSLEERDTFHDLELREREEFFAVKSPEDQDAYLLKKSLERKNQSMEMIEKQSGQIAVKSAEVLQSAWDGLLGLFTQITFLAVIPIYLFYFLSSNRNLLDDLDRELGFLSDSLREDVVFLLREFVGILVAFFRGQLLIGLLMGIGYAIGFSLSGLKFGITLGLLFGLLNIVPYLGSIVGVCVTLLVAYFQPDGIAESGEWNVLFSCAASFVIVQVIESYYLTPKIMGQQTGLHPVVVIVSIFFWGTALGGILGMIFGIPLTAFIIIAWRLLCRKYLNRSFC